MRRTRTLITGSALAVVLALVSSTAMAEDRDLGKHSEDAIKSACNNAGAPFLSDGQTYGCKKACPGGTCAVICDKDDGCIGVTPAKRRQGASGERGVLDALNGRMNTTEEQDNKGFAWGLVGLLGLGGLLALMRRPGRGV